MPPTERTRAQPVYDVPFLHGFRIDSDLAEWADDGFRVSLLGIDEDNRRLVDRDDLDLSFRLGWTPAGLALLARVRAHEYVEDPDGDRLVLGDHLQVSVADSAAGRNVVTLLVAPGMTSDQPELRHTLRDHRREDLRNVPARASVARAKRTEGYVVEALVPWPVLGIVPQPGIEIGFQFYMAHRGAEGPAAIVTWFPCLRDWRPADSLHALRLSTAATPAFDQAAFAWVDYADMARARYHVVCHEPDAGRTVSVLSGANVLAQATARPEDGAAVARLEAPYPQVGSGDEVQQIRIGDRLAATALVRARAGRRLAAVMGKPAFARHAFSGESFPPCNLARQPDVRQWFGECRVSVQHCDAECRPVARAAAPGRYGAVVTVTPAYGEAFRLYRTLWRTDGNPVPGQADRLSDALWWAALKTRAGLPDEAVLDGLAEWDEIGGEFAGQFYRSARVLTTCLEFLGDPARSVEIMGVSGASWRLLWDEGRWRPGISSMSHFGHLVEERRVFDAIGRDHLFLARSEGPSGNGYTEHQMRAAVCTQIDAGRPVVAYGLTDRGQAAVVGYRRRGHVLVVAWGGKRESYREVLDWAKAPHFTGFLLVGRSKPASPPRDRIIGALKLAVEMARTPQVNGFACGLAAYDAWARDLLRDEHFPPEDTEPLRQVAWAGGEAALAHVDARPAAVKYLRAAREHVGGQAVDHLASAAELHDREWHAVMSRHDYMPWGGEQGGHLIQVTTRANREALAEKVLEAKEHYAAAVAHIEKALHAEGVSL
jgi:hypothetical protein